MPNLTSNTLAVHWRPQTRALAGYGDSANGLEEAYLTGELVFRLPANQPLAKSNVEDAIKIALVTAGISAPCTCAESAEWSVIPAIVLPPPGAGAASYDLRITDIDFAESDRPTRRDMRETDEEINE